MKQQVLVVALFFGVLAITGCTKPMTNLKTNPDPEPTIVSTVDEQLTLVATESGKTAYDLLGAEAKVEAITSSEGEVTLIGINGRQINNDYYWAIYHNGEQTVLTPEKIQLEVGDVVDFIYSPIGENK